MLQMQVGLGLLSFCLVGSALAADVAGSHDLPVLPRFPRAEIVNFQQDSDQLRIYPQGSISRISGRLRMEKEVRVTGSLTAVTYRLPEEEDAQSAFEAARRNLFQANATPLYWCEGRDCGSSNLLANAVFGNARLYGPDDQQAYLLVRLPAPQQDSLLAVYSIVRGSGRAYLHAEQLNALELGDLLPNPTTLMLLLKTNGSLPLSHLPARPEGVWLDLLVQTLRLDSGMRVKLAGQQAEQWRAALIGQGVPAARLTLDTLPSEGLHLIRLP